MHTHQFQRIIINYLRRHKTFDLKTLKTPDKIEINLGYSNNFFLFKIFHITLFNSKCSF